MELDQQSCARSYAYCMQVARSRAKNFYYSFLLLSRQQRKAMCAIYAFMRYCDDLSDDPEDRIWVTMRNPRLVPLDEMRGKDAEAVACDALIVPVVTGSPNWDLITEMITLVTDAASYAPRVAPAAEACRGSRSKYPDRVARRGWAGRSSRVSAPRRPSRPATAWQT